MRGCKRIYPVFWGEYPVLHFRETGRGDGCHPKRHDFRGEAWQLYGGGTLRKVKRAVLAQGAGEHQGPGTTDAALQEPFGEDRGNVYHTLSGTGVNVHGKNNWNRLK